MKRLIVLAAVIASALSLSGPAPAGWVCLTCPPTPDPAPIHQGGWCQHCA